MISKINTDNRGIGILETLWKVVEAIIDTRLQASIQFQDVLHKFCSGRGKGTATMDIKLTQELASFNQDPLFLVFLNMRKAYNTVDHVRLIRTLEGYGEGPHM